MLVEAQLQETIRDWIILAFSAASLLWTTTGQQHKQSIVIPYIILICSLDANSGFFPAACFLIIRGRNMIFNRLWMSRLFLAVNGFLWPASFVLSTQQFALSIASPDWEPDVNCRRFTFLVYAILEPAFCILLVLHIQFDCNICSRIPSLSNCSGKSKRHGIPSAISSNCICCSSIIYLLPSIAYHLSWIFLASSSPWYTNEQPPLGPCTLPLENLLGVSVYVAVSLLFVNVFSRRYLFW